jgi:hypothetical protein
VPVKNGSRATDCHRCASCVQASITVIHNNNAPHFMNELGSADSDLRNSRRERGKPTHLLRGLIPVRQSQSRKVEIQHTTLLYRIQTWQTTIRLTDYTVCQVVTLFVPTFRRSVLPLVTCVPVQMASCHLSVHCAHVRPCNWHYQDRCASAIRMLIACNHVVNKSKCNLQKLNEVLQLLSYL